MIPEEIGNFDVSPSGNELADLQIGLDMSMQTLSLFTERSSKSKVMMAPKGVNFRKVRQENFFKKGHHVEPSMDDAAREDGGNSFQNGVVHSIFYERGPISSENNAVIESISKVNYWIEGKKVKNASVVSAGVSPWPVSKNTLKTLQAILNVRMLYRDDHTSNQIYDYRDLLNLFLKFFQGKWKKESLSMFCHNLQWPDVVEDCQSDEEANEMFWLWMTYLTPVRISNLEGNHRAEYVGRTVFGFKIGSAVPLKREDDFEPIPETSTCYKQTACVILLPKSRSFSVTFVAKFGVWSQKIQTEQTLTIKFTHQALLCNIANKINSSIDDESLLKLFSFVTTPS